MNTTATHNEHAHKPERVLYVAFELSEKTWKLGFTLGPGQKPVLRRNRIRPYLSRIERGPNVDWLRVSRPIRPGHGRSKRSQSIRIMVVTSSG
jgi:hypothetical protein